MQQHSRAHQHNQHQYTDTIEALMLREHHHWIADSTLALNNEPVSDPGKLNDERAQ